MRDVHTNQTQKSSQKRPNSCAKKRSGQHIPKPERNRLDEGKSKKLAVNCRIAIEPKWQKVSHFKLVAVIGCGLTVKNFMF